ncbi:MAG: steroid 5-alpha reductase family enzyme [Candidatus Aldehydirespiratoraceae bacterium]
MNIKKQNQISIVGLLATLVIGAGIALAGSSGSVEAGGIAVFAIAAILAYAINWIVFVPSYLARTEAYFDLTGSLTYISLIVVSVLASNDVDARALVVAAAVVIWAVRLGSFLFRRVKRDGGDGRFDWIKTNFLRFLMTWSLQGLWVLLTLAAALAVITAEDRENIDAFMVIGMIVWLIGFAIEVVADRQKSAFRADPANEGRFVTSGLWAWSRHPNYFGEITLWVGIAIAAIPVLSGWRWLVLISPVFVVVLLTRISGIPMLERRGEKRWGDDPEFRAYTNNTSVLIPRPPRSS